jgi:hypothetical protein
MKQFLYNHRWALFLSLVVGCITVAPAILAPLSIGSAYRGIQYAPLNDEDTYRTLIHEVLDGHPMVISPFFYEYKNGASTAEAIPPLNSWVYGYPAFVLGLSATLAISKFLFPAVLFLLTYWLVLLLIGEESFDAKLCAIAAGLLVVFGADMADYHYLFTALKNPNALRANIWTRPQNPIVGGVELFGFFALLWSVVQKRFRYAYIPAGVVFALTVGYYFSFGIAGAFLAALVVLMALKKEWRVARDLVLVGVVMLIADCWYWYGAITSFGGTSGTAAAERNGMFLTHAPVFNLFLFVATIIVGVCFGYSYFAKKITHTNAWLFVASLLIAGWIAFNEQIITGKEIWYYHFVQYTVPLSLVAAVVAFYFALRPVRPRAWRALMLFACAATLLYGAASIYSFVPDIPAFTLEQQESPAIEWLNTNAPADCVVLLANYIDDLEPKIPAYTQCNLYDPQWLFSGVPQERTQHDFFIRLWLQGVSGTDAKSYLLAHDTEVRAYFYDNWAEYFGSGVDPWVQNKIATLVPEYQQFLQSNIKTELQQYRLDYILSDGPLPKSLLAELPGLKVKVISGPYYFYSF